LGAYLQIDPTLVRLFFVLMAFAQGLGVVLYLLLWILLPAEDSLQEAELSERIHDGAEEMADSARRLGQGLRSGGLTNPQTATAVGLGLIIIGAITLARNFAWLSWLNAQVVIPGLLILAGAVLLYRYWKDNP
jgi:hypothetical protein